MTLERGQKIPGVGRNVVLVVSGFEFVGGNEPVFGASPFFIGLIGGYTESKRSVMIGRSYSRVDEDNCVEVVAAEIGSTSPYG
jgi:hypothetical protein